MQRKFRSKSSTLKGLLYTPIQQKQYHKRTTLRRLKIPLQIIVARKVHTIALEGSAKKPVMRHAINAIWHAYIGNPAARHSARKAHTIALEQSARKLSEDKQQSTYSQVWISFGDSIPGLYCVAWLTQESVSLRIFVRKKGMNHVQSKQTFTADTYRKRRKRENSPVVKLLPGSHKRLTLRNPRVLFQKNGGACMMY